MVKFKKSAVIFDEENHTYTLKGKKLSGVTGLIHQVLGLGVYPDADPYVKDHVIPRAGSLGTAVHHAIQDYEELGIVEPNQIVYTKYGSKENNNEHYVDEEWFVANQLNAYVRHLDEYRFKCLATELLVSDNKNYASCIDNVWEYEETGGIWLVDTKTNNVDRYPLCGYFNPNYFATGKDALKEYLSWQLSVYAELFEYNNPGLKVEGLACNWLRKDDDAFWIIERKPSHLVWELLKTDFVELDSGMTYFHPDLSVFGIGSSLPSEPSLPMATPDNTPIMNEDVVSYTYEFLNEEENRKECMKNIKEGLRAAMKEHNVKSYDFGGFTATLSADSVATTFDATRFKKEYPELYNEYVVKKEKKGSLTLKLKNNDKIQN